MISLVELSAGLFYMIAHLTENYVEDIREHNMMLSLFKFSECDINYTTSDNATSDSVLSLYYFLFGVGRSTELCWIVLSVCLMN